jgi:hypothetical protein
MKHPQCGKSSVLPRQQTEHKSWFCVKRKRRGRRPLKVQNNDPRCPYFYYQYHGKGHNTEPCPETKKNIARIPREKTMMSIASTMSNQFRSNFWQRQYVSHQPNPVTVQQFQQAQSSWQPSQQFYPQSQAIQTI